MAVTRKLLFLLLFVLGFERLAHAKTKFEILNSFFIQKSNSGNQVEDGSGDEDVWVYEPQLFLETQINSKTSLSLSALVDVWSSASEAIFDTYSGASRRYLAKSQPNAAAASAATPVRNLEHRIAFDLGVTQKLGTWSLSPQIGYSNEFDYKSYHGGLTIAKSFAADNFTLSAGYFLYLDQTHPFDFLSGDFTNWQNKTTHSWNLSASQILTPSDIILVGYHFTWQSGFLAGIQNTIDLNNIRMSETLPDSRLRHSVTVRYIHGFSNTLSLHADERIYFDNWGLFASTTEPALYLGFHDDAGLVKAFYRFHTQTAVDYYQDQFTTAAAYMTSDSDLSNLISQEIGLAISHTWDFKKSFMDNITLSASALYYNRSNGLDAELVQFGFSGGL